MKKVTSNINLSASPTDIYNQMPRVRGTGFHEAKRTLEAIKTVNKHPQLMKEVIKVTERM